VLACIPGLKDRQRLTVSVWFPSPAIAAKVVTGAHVAGSKWVTVIDPQALDQDSGAGAFASAPGRHRSPTQPSALVVELRA
jgi:hypothetical protein